MPAEVTQSDDAWLSAPVAEASRRFLAGLAAGRTADAAERDVSSALAAFVRDPAVWQRLPLVNAAPSHEWRADRLARFRGMVQDMYDPEVYLRAYGVRSPGGGARTACGMFRDVASCGADEYVDEEPAAAARGSRHTLRCVSVPHRTAWARDAERAAEGSTVPPPAPPVQGAPAPTGVKRRADDEDEDWEMGAEDSPVAGADKLFKEDPTPSAAQTSGAAPPAPPVCRPSAVLPPDGDDMACLVKVYDDEHGLSLNDMVEFVGVLALDPRLETAPAGGDADADGMAVEHAAHNPPPSLAPRLHAVAWRRLAHSNPLVAAGESALAAGEAAEARRHLLSVLQTVLLGDALAAELLLCHLVSAVHVRRDVTVVGKFALNLSGVPAGGLFAGRLVDTLRRLTEKVCPLPVSLQELNRRALVPRKDYRRNVLVTGELQLSRGTHLVLDETVLTQGQLDERGVTNLAALGHLIAWQRVEYDFGFHRLAYDADVPTLVLSEGRSLLPSDCRLPLRPTVAPQRQAEQYRALDEYLTSPLLHQIRRYLTLARHTPYSVPERLLETVQREFVGWRQDAGGQVGADDLHRRLVLARLLSVTYGLAHLTEPVWRDACRLDDQRRHREKSAEPLPAAAA